MAAVVLAGCGTAARALPYDDLSGRVAPAEFPRQTRQLFHSRRELVDYLEHAMPGRRLHVPPIDFDRSEAILIAAGPRSSTGYVLRILRVQEQGRRVVVTVRERTPNLGDPVRARVTYPFRLITVRRGHTSLRVKWLGRP